MILLEVKPRMAARVLQEATSIANSDPVIQFHLAVAYWRLGELTKSRSALEAARDRDLSIEDLSKTENRLLLELEKSLPH